MAPGIGPGGVPADRGRPAPAQPQQRAPPLVNGLSFLGQRPGPFLQDFLKGKGADLRSERKRPATASLGPEPDLPPTPAARLASLRADVADFGREEALRYLELDVFDACATSIGRSGASYSSQLQCFFGFCEAVGVEPLAISEPFMCAYAQLFRNGRSLKGYLTAVRWMYDVSFIPLHWAGRSLALVVRGILAGTPPLKKAPAISWADTERLYCHARSKSDFLQAYAYSLASHFSLRVPDECLPLCFSDLATHSSLAVELLDDGRSCVTLHLRRRKNARFGARLRRFCVCQDKRPAAPCTLMCPVQCFRQFLADSGRSGLEGRVFERPEGGFISESSFSRVLKAHCKQLSLTFFAEASSHGFRRGTAQAIHQRGDGLSALLASGGWTSSAFLQYLDTEALDALAVYDLFESAMAADPALAGAKQPPKAKTKGPAAPAAPCRSMKDFFASAKAADLTDTGLASVADLAGAG